MIEKLNNKELKIAKNIYSVFQSSYKVEAKLLNAKNFPPLKRSVENFLKSNSIFFGFYNDIALTGIIELIKYENYTHIRSLVVDPSHFRKGIASKLMKHTFTLVESNLIVVETGVKNKPAIKLYEQFGFKETKQWDTDHGVRKVKLEKNNLLPY
jgi:ribosomal protein S18 acetylase RimI-like enzyme